MDDKQDLGADLPITLLGTNFAPKDGATNVEPRTKISFSINASIDEDALNEGSFLIRSADETIPASLSYDSTTRTLILSPIQSLPLATQIDVSYTSLIADRQGNTIRPGQWSFTTRGGKWSPTQTLTQDISENVFEPQISVNAQGVPTVIWGQENDGGFSSLYSSTVVNTEWTAPHALDFGVENALGGKITTDGQRQYVAWSQKAGQSNNSSIWAIQSSMSEWNEAKELEASPNFIDSVSVKSSGRASTYLVWRSQVPNGPATIRISHLEAGLWSAPVTLGNGDVEDLQLMVDEHGTPTIAWRAINDLVIVRDNTGTNVFSDLVFLSRQGSNLRLATNNNGESFAIWLEGNSSSGRSITLSEYVNDAWSSPETIYSTASLTNVAFDINNNREALITWVENNQVLAISVNDGQGTLKEIGSRFEANLDVKIDEDGNGFATWESASGIHVRRFEKGKGWSDSRTIMNGRDSQIFVEKIGSWLVWAEGGTQIMLERFE